jgi:hypothetical protein
LLYLRHIFLKWYIFALQQCLVSRILSCDSNTAKSSPNTPKSASRFSCKYFSAGVQVAECFSILFPQRIEDCALVASSTQAPV